MTRPEDEVLWRLMLAFRGTRVPAWLRERLATAPAAGFTLFRPDNVRTPRQVRALTDGLQAAARARPGSDGLPILISTDQEGGQLLALGARPGAASDEPGRDWTGFAGPMAIGATGDADLAERVGRAIGLELRAVGVNVNYTPVLDLVDNPDSPALGIRSFGDDPAQVARLASAWLRGLQSAGVAGTGKHFPGKGGAGVDTHDRLAVVERSREDVAKSELVPFRALTNAGLKVVMSGHFANPALTGSADLPATLSRGVMHDLLRDELGFTGVSITDALDMGALPQGAIQAVDVVAALDAGVDLLLSTVDSRARARIEQALVRAAQIELLDDGAAAKGYDAIVAGTISATPGSAQAELVRGLLASGRPVVTVALRTPWDLAAYPEAGTHVCTYSILPESMTALAAALLGRADAAGLAFPARLPARLDVRRVAA